jgi:hypothetical protein
MRRSNIGDRHDNAKRQWEQGGLSLLIALGIVGLLLVKVPKWFPLPIAHVLGLGDVYPTQGLIGPQKIIHDWESASRP